ncbi:MAG: tetratricopeptide repeat protein [Bryobacteraceae bacterium]
MAAGSLSHRSRSEKTFAVALSLLLAVAATQLIGALFLAWQRNREVRRAEAPSAAEVASAPDQTSAPSTLRFHPPRAKVHSHAAAPVSVPDQLLQMARALRRKGDTATAIAKLQEAASLSPDNPEILAELALTYESMQIFDRSNETWRRLQSLGSAAGPLAELAQLKLKLGVPAPGLPNATSQGLAAANGPDGTARIPEGSSFGISQVTQTNVNNPDDLTDLTLRVGVQVRHGVAIDHTKVKIQVFFYDVLDNDKVVLTDANVSYEWITPGHDWTNSDTEVLDIHYERPKKTYPAPGTADTVPDSVEKAKREEKKRPGGADLLPSNERDNRQYLGYIVRVYYKDELQVVRADPTRLLNLFPPPFIAPPQ